MLPMTGPPFGDYGLLSPDHSFLVPYPEVMEPPLMNTDGVIGSRAFSVHCLP